MGGPSSTSSPNPHYTLPNDWESADERLAMLGAAYDPDSIALALGLGVGAGTRCLEAGAGGGSFARWLCQASLPAKLDSLGLVDSQAKTEIPTFRGNSPLARMWDLTWTQVHDTLVSIGLPDEVISAAQSELQDGRRWFYAPPTIRAWARAPE